MSTNPKIFVKINKAAGIISPVSGIISKELDTAFLSTKTIEDNKSQYNEYTKWFIENSDDYEVYWSDAYEYDPSNKTFNFYNVNPCDGDDYIEMSTEPTRFDHNRKYSFGNSSEPKAATVLDDIRKSYACPGIDSGFYVEEKRWNILVRNILKHQNTMLVGPTGTGKTDIIIRICKAMNIPCRIYDMGAMIDPLTDLLGSHRLENGTSKFDYAKFVQDIQEPGVILLDELSRAPQMTNNILFPCLDHRRMLPVEIADSNGLREVPVHPDVTFIATANIGSEYSGTGELDAALENRFMTIQVDYLPKSIETEILKIRTECPSEVSEKICSIANGIRQRYLEGILSKTVSTRETLNCAELYVDGFSILDAVSFAFCEKFPKTGENSEYETVKKFILGF